MVGVESCSTVLRPKTSASFPELAPQAIDKEETMSNDLFSAVTPRVSPTVDRLSATAAAVPGMAKPEVKAPVKADIQYDPAQMRRNLEEAIKRLNDQMQQHNRNLSFSMDQSTKSLVIVVKNSETGEVVRQIPEESVLRVAHNMENLKGLMLNTRT